MMSSKPLPWWVQPALAAMILGIFGFALYESINHGNETLITTMFTGALSLASVAAGFYFGSSSGSQKKDEAIAASAAGPPTPPTP